jgi:glycosyltransferase involved in cell wall biosynthesis
MEGDFVTGPAKNLIEFAQRARDSAADLPAVELSIGAYRRGREAESAFIQAARSAGIAVDVIPERGRFDRSAITEIRRIAGAREPDIIQTHNVKSHFFLRLSGLWQERAWLAFHHGYTAEDFKMRCYNSVNRWSLRAPRHVVTVCGPFVEQLVRQGIQRERITVLHNSVKPFQTLDDEKIRLVRASIPAAENTPILISIGRLSHEKGHLDLLNALALLREWKCVFHAVFVGEGVERPRIEAARERLGLQQHVTLAGLQHDVRAYFRMAQAAVIASHSEGSPNALLEAMAAGLPIVATSVGGIPEIARDGESALLVEPHNPEALAQAIRRVLQSSDLRNSLSACAQAKVVTYSPVSYYRALVGIYQRVLALPAEDQRS